MVSVTWPQVPALLLLESFMASVRSELLLQASSREPGAWTLRTTVAKVEDADQATNLMSIHALLCAEMPNKCRVVHKDAAGKQHSGILSLHT